MRKTKQMSPREVAGTLGLRLDSVYALLWAGRLPGNKRDGRWYVAADAVMKRLKAKKSYAR
jgi:hypothetical protein